MAQVRKVHCGECLRRRLVCDFEVPGCRRCARSGVECPGYGDSAKVRLRWVTPGETNSKKRKGPLSRQKNKNSPTSASHRQRRSESSDTNSEASTVMQPVTIPSFDLKTDYHALIDSVEYFNSCMYPQLANSLRLGTNTNIYKLPPTILGAASSRPTHLRSGLVCLTLSHRMNQMGHDLDSKPLKSHFFRHRGLMIQSLNEDINDSHKRDSDIVFAGILSLLLADVQQGVSPHWRYHIEGVKRLINLRGGMFHLAATPGLLPIVLCFVYLVVISDTSSPASNMLIGGLNSVELGLFIQCFGENGYGFQMCPTPLFAEILEINNVRCKISTIDETDDSELHSDAREVLRRIYEFSPTAWIEANENLTNASKLVVETYQSAVALYCMSSLQSMRALPPSPLLTKNRDTEKRILHGLVERLLQGGSYGYPFWPLLVLGMQAVDGSPSLRAFVRNNMTCISVRAGTYAPLAARDLLEKFWNSGKNGWDDCFDQPHVLTTILTVNRGQLRRAS
ncbi:unnamed protein product [Penicillium olsonii]|nr:unnamed protein product [Penicillium olsonii]CAG7930445.1 unnamed protein product [Penicillium olsonii]